MIFLDNASTTSCLESSAEIVKNALVNNYLNPSSKYKEALITQRQLDSQRDILLGLVGANSREYGVIFTGSATEANNLVLSSSLSKHKDNIVSIGEHSSIYETAKYFNEEGRKVSFARLNENGELDKNELIKAITDKTAFLSFMLVSNETGAITSAEEIIKEAKKINPKLLVHVDAVQAFCKVDVNIKKLGADYLTLSSHKVHGPKGVGALIYKKSAKLEPQILGGGQEGGKRAGTENLPSILGFINSAKVMHDSLKENYNLVKEFKFNLVGSLDKLSKENDINLVINGNIKLSSPYILSVSFPGYKGEVILHSLEARDVLVGTGSACNSAHSGNRVLEAMGRTKSEVEGNIRLSFSAETPKLYNAQDVAEKIIGAVKSIKR